MGISVGFGGGGRPSSGTFTGPWFQGEQWVGTTIGYPSGNVDIGGTRRVRINSVNVNGSVSGSGVRYALDSDGVVRIYYNSAAQLRFTRYLGNGLTVFRTTSGGFTWTGGGLQGSYDYSTVPSRGNTPSISVNSQAAGSLNLSWSAPNDGGDGIDGYRVYLNGSQVATTGSRSITITGLTPGASYYAQIAAYNGVGTGQASSNSGTVTVTGFPTAPRNFTAVASGATSGRIDLNWTVPSETYGGVTSYKIYRNGSLYTTVGSATTSYIDTGLSTGTSYSYYVRATNQFGEGTATATLSVVAPGVPSAPRTLVATPGTTNTDTGKIYLSWQTPSTTVSTITGYDIYRDNVKITATTGTSTNFVDTSLTAGQLYVYKVQARNLFADNTGLRSPDSNTSTAMAPGVPGRPLNLIVGADSVTAGKLNLSWEPPLQTNGTITGYDVYRNGALLVALVGQATTYSNSGLTEGLVFTYEIFARNSFADTSGLRSAGSGISSGIAPGLPTAPRDFEGGADLSLSATINLSWTPPENPKGAITGYRIYQKLSGDASFSSTPTYITTGAGTEFQATELVVGAVYNFKIAARNAFSDARNSEGANSATITVLAIGLPTAPVLDSATPSTTQYSTVALSWQVPTITAGGITDYYIYVDGILVKSVVGESSTSTEVTGLNERQTYSFTVRARNSYAIFNRTTGPASNAINAKSPGPPSPPRSLVATPPAGLEGVIDLTWLSPLDTAGTLTGYDIYFSTGSLISQTQGSGTSFRVTGLVPSVQYSFYVRARNTLSDFVGVDSPPSNTATATALGEPSEPINVAVASSNLVAGRLVLTWDAPLEGGAPAGYNVYFANGTRLGETAAEEFVVDGLSVNQEYSFYVRARNSITDATGIEGGTISAIVTGRPGSTSSQTFSTGRVVSNQTNTVLSGSYPITTITSNTVSYVKSALDVESSGVSDASGSVVNNTNTILSGTYTVTGAPEADQIQYSRVGPNLPTIAVPSGTVTNDTNAIFNGRHEVLFVDFEDQTITYAAVNADISSRAVPTTPEQTVSNTTSVVFNADNEFISAVTETTFSFPRTSSNIEESLASGTVLNNTNREIYNGSFVVATTPDYQRFTYSTGDDVTQRNIATNPSMEYVGEGSSILRTNYYTNPRMRNSTTGWTVLASGATQTPDINGTVIDFSDEVAPTNSFFFETNPIPIEIGEYSIASLEVTVPEGFPSLSLRSVLTSYGSGNSSVVTVTIDPGQTVRLTSTPYLTTATSTGVRHLIGSTATIPIGARLVVRNAIFEKTNVAENYFDGATTSAKGWDYDWTGTDDASTSVAEALAVVIRKNEITNPGFETTSTGQTVRTNFLTNPSFEAINTGWLTSATGMSQSRSSLEVNSGVASLQAVSTETDSWVSSPAMSVNDGASYTFSAWVKGTSGNTVAVRIEEFDISSVSSGVTDSADTTLTGSWQRISVTRNLSASASTAKVYVVDKKAGDAGQTFYVDDVLFEQTAFVFDFFSGATADSDGYSHVWAGTPNASISTVVSSSTYSTNLATNPSIESVEPGSTELRVNLLNNPVPVDSGGLVWSVSEAGPSGVYAQTFTAGGFEARVTTQPLTTVFTLRAGTDSGTTGRVAVDEQKSYTLSATVVSSIGDARAIVIEWYNSAGTFVSRSASTRFSLVSGVPQRISVTGVAPEGAVTAGLVFAWVGTTGPDPSIRVVNSTYTVRNALFEQTNQLRPYFDGTTADGLGWAYDWSGVANESTSVGVATATTVRENAIPTPSMEVATDGDVLVATNLLTNPSMETSGGSVTVRTNLSDNPSMEGVEPGSTIARRNFIPNPSFETNKNTWTAGADATLTRVTSQYIEGSASGEIVATAVDASVTVDAITVDPSGTYTFSLWVEGVAGKSVYLQLAELTSGASEVGRTSSTELSTNGTWQRLSVTRTFGLTGVSAVCVVKNSSSVASHTFYIDGVMLEQNSTVADYFDGSTVDVLGWDFAWEGTAHASSSVAKASSDTVRTNLSTNPSFETASGTVSTPVGTQDGVAGVTAETSKVYAWQTTDDKLHGTHAVAVEWTQFYGVSTESANTGLYLLDNNTPYDVEDTFLEGLYDLHPDTDFDPVSGEDGLYTIGS
jgi:hypothetical protein